jgi:diguanylate cyclase (GGDEF)-like protein/PAS domain S-box-containing protein
MKNRPDVDRLSRGSLLAFIALSAATVALLAIFWKFGIEELVDPFLPGEHATDSAAERWEFVVVATLFSVLSLLVPTAVVRRLVRERLAASRLSAAVFKSAPQPMVVTDRQRRVIAVNPAFEKLTGYPAEAVIHTPVAFLKSDLNNTTLYDDIGLALDRNGAWSGEIRNRRPDGSQYVVWLNITATRDEAGEVSEFIGVLTDITWRKRQEEEAIHQATHDPLTGLANRRLFMERLEQILASTPVTGERLAVLFLDLDGFKEVNDTRGHAVGDAVLQEAARRLAACARSADFPARLAGDEFVLLLRNVESATEAEVVAQRCVERIAELREACGQAVEVGASVGVALSTPATGSADELLAAADQAMYAAKRLGKGRYALYATASGPALV